jgi:hypothetical protein
MQDVMQISQPQKQQYPTTTTSSYKATEIQQPWHLRLPTNTPTENVAFAAVNHSASIADLAAFAHAALFSPVPSTLYKV